MELFRNLLWSGSIVAAVGGVDVGSKGRRSVASAASNAAVVVVVLVLTQTEWACGVQHKNSQIVSFALPQHGLTPSALSNSLCLFKKTCLGG